MIYCWKIVLIDIVFFLSNSEQVYIVFDAVVLLDLYKIRIGIKLATLKKANKTNTLQSDNIIRRVAVF